MYTSTFKFIVFFYLQILFDFGVLFESVNQKALEEKWQNMVSKLHAVFKIEVPSNIAPITDVDLLNFIGLLKLFSAVRTQLPTSVKSVLTFSKVRQLNFIFWSMLVIHFICQDLTDDPMKLMDGKNLSPKIIIVWSKESGERKYYIDVKKSLISVSFV